MLTTHLGRGVLTGVVGGVAYGLYSALVIVPMVTFAESFETGHQTAGGPVVSEPVTVVASVGAGGAWGLLLGFVVFGVVYYFTEPALSGRGLTKSYLLCAAGFFVISGSPWVMLPPVAPGVKHSLPTGTRILLYGGMVLLGVAGVVIAIAAYNYLGPRVPMPIADVLPLVAIAVLLVGAVVVAPSDSTRSDLPTTFAFAFRWMVVFGQLGLWFVLGSVHAWFQCRDGDDRHGQWARLATEAA